MTNRISRNEGDLSIDQCMARIERLDPLVNAVVVRDFDRASEVLATGRPLAGVPVTVKESFDVAGLPTTLGMHANTANVARTD